MVIDLLYGSPSDAPPSGQHAVNSGTIAPRTAPPAHQPQSSQMMTSDTLRQTVMHNPTNPRPANQHSRQQTTAGQPPPLGVRY